MDTLPPQRAAVLAFLRQQLETGQSPSLAEIAHALGFASRNSAQKHVQALAEAGLIEIASGRKRGIRLPGGQSRADLLVLPVLTLALPLAAQIARLTRASLMDELKADFVRTARAKGAAEGSIVLEHALRPAFGPVLAYLATAAAGVLTGSMVVESLFAIPGLGYFFVAGALQQDWTVITGAALFYAALLVIFNLLADLGLLWCDPRTR